jgi:proline iminopeptidase
MEIRADDGASLWATSSGRGRPAIVLHGGPGVWDYLGSLVDPLDGLFAAVRFDQRGCGRSGGIDGPFADVDAVRATAGLDPPILVGHSWGATLALLYALKHPARVAGVVYVAGVGLEWVRWKREFHETARVRQGADAARIAELLAHESRSAAEEREYLQLAWTADHPDPAVGRVRAAAMLDARFQINYRAGALLNREVESLDPRDLADRCRSLRVPVLVIEGSVDPRPNAAVDSLVAALPAVRRCTIARAGHFPWLDSPEEFRAAIAEWLATVP